MLFTVKYKLIYPGIESRPKILPIKANSEAEARRRLFSLVRSANPQLVPETVILEIKEG